MNGCWFAVDACLDEHTRDTVPCPAPDVVPGWTAAEHANDEYHRTALRG